MLVLSVLALAAGSASCEPRTLTSANGSLVVTVDKKSVDTSKNIYLVRKNLDTTVRTSDSAGHQLGERKFFLTVDVATVAPQGRYFAVIDTGFDPFDGDSNPDVSGASPADRKLDLSYHQVMILDRRGEIVWNKRITGRTNSPPRVIGFSTGDKHLLYQTAHSEYGAVDVLKKSERVVNAPEKIIPTEILDDGTIRAFKKESDERAWKKRPDGSRYLSGGKITSRIYVLKPGESEFEATDEMHVVN